MHVMGGVTLEVRTRRHKSNPYVRVTRVEDVRRMMVFDAELHQDRGSSEG
jgi:hypothetical protein